LEKMDDSTLTNSNSNVPYLAFITCVTITLDFSSNTNSSLE